jgi:signal transduction histidine kinase
MIKLLSYLKYRFTLMLFFLIAAALTLLIQFLANQSMVYAWYTVGLMSFFLLLILFVDGARYFRHRHILSALSATLYHTTRELPEPSDALEADYVRCLQELGSAYDAIKKQLSSSHNDSLEYYTLWVHQIKTPIAALSLVLQNMDSEQVGVIRQELFKIEQYADLALRYVKLSDISSDLVIERCLLDDVVSASVKKYAVLFIYQKLSLDLTPVDGEVMSDKRWLSFIVEQILSNAIKYTYTGGVKIDMQNGKLVIEDTGIGIRAEDLPRIFMKGYTGCNGRIDNRASGIGLYLAKKAADALGITISVESKVGTGTKVSLTFPEARTDIFREALIK